METIITKSQVADAVYAAIPQLACVLPADIASGLEAARATEDSLRGRAVLDQLVENARIAAADCVPICQDTGTVWVSLEVGPDMLVPGDVFAEVNNAVARAYDAVSYTHLDVYKRQGEMLPATLPDTLPRPPFKKKKPFTEDGVELKAWKMDALPYLCLLYTSVRRHAN